MGEIFMDKEQLLLQQQLDVFMLPDPPGGRFFNLTERNPENRGSPYVNFDMKRPTVAAAGNATNITEHVIVPTSEHVAEIVGRQGCKIKALRNKTNTYIKTPGRGENPLFTITGQKSDVEMAVLEIRQASMHFTNIRAQRTKGISPPNIEGSITDRVQVPYRVVGLVVGPKGQTIKQIQAKTDTFIVTPSRERDPIFEITGRPEDVAKAREEIVSYICIRTGMTLEENNVGHFAFNSDEPQVDNLFSLRKDLAPITFSQFSERTPTGVWNPIKQEIEEFESTTAAQENVYLEPQHAHNLQGNRSYPKRLQGANSLLPHDIKTQAGKTTGLSASGKAMKFLGGNEMSFDLENQENFDPLRAAVAKKHLGVSDLTPRGPLLGSGSPMRGLNVQTYDPFCWDNSSLLKTRSNSPASPPKLGSTAGDILGLTDSGDEDFNSVRDTLQDLQLGSAFNPSEAAKISPLSNGSQHSSTESYSSIPSQQPINDVMTSFGGSLLGQWNPSPVQDIATSLVNSYNNTMTAEYSLAGTNIPDCWVLSPPKPSASKTSPYLTENAGAQKCHRCRDRVINAALVPCGHNHFCYECASACVGKNCPSCASEPSCALRIFK